MFPPGSAGEGSGLGNKAQLLPNPGLLAFVTIPSPDNC
jgi:hypothetical protein